MGNCIYCGNKLGLLNFRDYHKECLEKNLKGKRMIEQAVADAITTDQNLDELVKIIDSTALSYYVNANDKQEKIFRGWDIALNRFNDDNIITKEEESKLVEFQNHFNYTTEQLNKLHSYDLLAKSSIVRRLTAGEVVEVNLPEGYVLPIILQKDEKLLWAFPNSILFQPSTKTTYQGASQGVSVRVASGLYYRMGTFKGNPITTTEMKQIASGIAFYTTKNIFFSSPVKSIKIPFDKIISINLYIDGASIQKDGNSSKPFIFQNIDGAFLQNIIAISKQ